MGKQTRRNRVKNVEVKSKLGSSGRLRLAAEIVMQDAIDEQADVDEHFQRHTPEPEIDPADGFLLRRKRDFEDALKSGKRRWDVKRPFSSQPVHKHTRTSFACFLTDEEALSLHDKWRNDDDRVAPKERCVCMVKLSDLFWR